MADARAALGRAVVALVLGAMLGGCSLTDGAAPEDSPSAQGQVAPSSAGLGGESETRAVQAVARRVLAAWSRTNVGYTSWWSELRPLLSSGARETYAYTDPAAVPELDLPARGELTPGPHPGTATVYFETADGTFGVDLARARGAGPWRAERILFPDQPSLYAK